MTLRPLYFAALTLASLVLVAPVAAREDGAQAPPLPETPTVDAAAIDALGRMGAHLRSLEAFGLTAQDMIDEVLGSGQKIQLTKTVALEARKPDHLRVDIVTDRKAREFYYDGKQFTLFAPESKYYATVSAPSTIRELLDVLGEKYGIEFPLRDLFYWGADTGAEADIQEAMWVGASLIDGQLADHYAFRQEDVDWQIWIAQGDSPLPLRYVVTTKGVPGEPQYIANLSWNTQAEPADKVFTFTPSEDDKPIEMLVQTQVQDTP